VNRPHGRRGSPDSEPPGAVLRLAAPATVDSRPGMGVLGW
jgi:hypothetical protein